MMILEENPKDVIRQKQKEKQRAKNKKRKRDFEKRIKNPAVTVRSNQEFKYIRRLEDIQGIEDNE